MKEAPDSRSHSPESRGLLGWFAENHVAANILMLLFILGGLLSAFSMRTETFPSIDPNLITVSVAYPGATPYEVADSITNRIEEALIGIDGVKRISSVASEGSGIVNVELEDFANADDAYNDVDTAVNALVDFPPEDAERPIVTKVKVTPNVMSLAIHGNVEEGTLKYWAEAIEDDLRLLPGVALTSLRGIRDYQISVEVPEQSLREHGLSLEDVGNAINRFSIDTPAGTVEANEGDIVLRIQENRYTGAEYEQIVIRSLPDGSVLRLADIGVVIDGFEDVNIVSKFNGERAAFIDISRSETDDTLAVANVVNAYLDEVELPRGLQLSMQKDETVNLRDRISLMLRNAVLGFMLVFLVLMLFLDLKLAFWTSIAIPISFLGGLMFINAMGYSLNMITLFALIIVLGIVVDDAIVIGESIFDGQERASKSSLRKSKYNVLLSSVKDVISPVTIGVLTTIAAFAPLIFSTGTLGQIIRVIPVVVIPILVVSLIEAFFILPSHLSNPVRWSRGIVKNVQQIFSRGLARFVEKIFMPLARFAIQWRYACVAAFLSIAIITVGMMSGGVIRFIFFPQIESDEITITLNMPQGTSFSDTEQAMLSLEEDVLEVRREVEQEYGQDYFQSVSVSIGQTNAQQAGPRPTSGSNGNHLGQIIIQLLPSDFRSVSSSEVESMIRNQMRPIPNAETLQFTSTLVGGEADIEIELAHPDEAILNSAAETLKERLTAIPGAIDIQDSFEYGKTEYIFKLNKEGLAVGLSPAELGRQLRAAFFGLEVERFQRGRSEVLVYVRYPKDERESLSAIADTRIRLPNGAEVPLASVADIEQSIGFSQIQTVNGRRIVSITADADTAVTTPNDIMSALNTGVLKQLQDQYTGLSYSFEGESREQQEDLRSLGQNMLIAIMLIYVLLGAQLRSYTQPFVIMSAIPFGLIGAVWGHFLLGQDLTFISMFGIVALTGFVINASVVLLDYLNKQRLAGMDAEASSLAAIRRRFRPILLTTLTTSLGLLPMLMETSMQARFLIPMVISLAAGIVFATFIILLLVPALIMMMEDCKQLARRLANINPFKDRTTIEPKAAKIT